MLSEIITEAFPERLQAWECDLAALCIKHWRTSVEHSVRGLRTSSIIHLVDAEDCRDLIGSTRENIGRIVGGAIVPHANLGILRIDVRDTDVVDVLHEALPQRPETRLHLWTCNQLEDQCVALVHTVRRTQHSVCQIVDTRCRWTGNTVRDRVIAVGTEIEDCDRAEVEIDLVAPRLETCETSTFDFPCLDFCSLEARRVPLALSITNRLKVSKRNGLVRLYFPEISRGFPYFDLRNNERSTFRGQYRRGRSEVGVPNGEVRRVEEEVIPRVIVCSDGNVLS